MANRSYLYSVDTIPESGKKPKPIRSLAEFGCDVPVVYKILVSAQPRPCQSVIWSDHQIGVAADYVGGVERLLRFLDALRKSNSLRKDEEFMAAVSETKSVLANDKHKGRYILLEAGEIFEMSDDDLLTSFNRLIKNEIPDLAKKADAAIAGREHDWLDSLGKKWDELGLDWADVLCFDFGKES